MKLITPILIFMLAFPPILFADDPPDPPTVMGIQKGEVAPYAGVLLNSTAAAQIFAERNYSFDECKLRIDFNIEKEQAKYKALLENSEASLESLKNQYNSITSAKDKEIERLSKLVLETNDYSTLWAVGGTLMGIGLTIAVMYAVKQGEQCLSGIGKYSRAKLISLIDGRVDNATAIGDITGVTAGDGLTGGGASGEVTLDIDIGGSSGHMLYNDGTTAIGGATSLFYNDSTLMDDKKLYFGTGLDSFIEYEDSTDLLIISGSSRGMVLSGSTIEIKGTLEGASPLRIAGGIEIVSSRDGEPATAMAFGDDIELNFGDAADSYIKYVSSSHYFEISGTSRGILLRGDIATENNISASSMESTFTGDGSSITNVNAVQLNSQAASYYLDISNINAGTLNNSYLPATISQSAISASVGISSSLGQFDTLNINNTTLINNLNADRLDNQEGSYYLDFTNQIVDDDEISGNKIHGGSVSGLEQLTASYSILGTALATTLSASNIISANSFIGDGSSLTGLGRDGHTIQNSGSNMTARTNLNFIGTGVVTTDDVGSDTTTVTINVGSGSGETNTTSNEGAGIGIALPKESANLPFRSFIAGDNISFVTGSDTITIRYEPPSVDNGLAPNPNFNVGTRIANNGLDLVAGGVSRLFLSSSGYIGVNMTGDITHRLTLPNSSTGNDGKAVAHGWATYSSARYKEDIQTIEDPLAITKSLRGVTYKWKDSQKSDIGLIAEEVGKHLPEVVEWEENKVDAKSLDYTRIVPVLIEAIKNQQSQIDKLKDEIIFLKDLPKDI